MARKPLALSSFAQGPFPEASFALPVPFTLNRQTCPLHHGQWDLSSFNSPLLHLLASPQRSLLLPLVIRAGRGLFPSSEASPHHSCSPFVSASPSPIPHLSLQVSSHPEIPHSFPPSSPVSTAPPATPPSLFSCFLTSSPCHLTFHPAVL